MLFDPNQITFHKTKSDVLPGPHYQDVLKIAKVIFANLQSRTKRKPYVRSAYFRKGRHKEKIFFDYFWQHLMQKPPKERYKRLKFFEAALEVVNTSRSYPFSMQNPDKKAEIFHRFGGITRSGKKFYVQIKEHSPTGAKQLMSVFPAK